MFWGGLVLLLWAIVELANQSATITTSITDSSYRAYRDGALSFTQFLNYLPWKVLWLPLFLLGCVVLGLLALFTRRRLWLHALMVPAAIAALVITLDTPLLFRWLGIDALWRVLNSFKILSLGLVALGSGLHLYCLMHFRKRRQRLKANNAPGVRRWQ